jgi:hypothetical protein
MTKPDPSPARKPRKRRTNTQITKETLVDQLWRTAAGQVAEIEQRLTKAGTPERADGAATERDAKTLAILARTVRELQAIDAAPPRHGPHEATEDTDDDSVPRDRDKLRDALAQRLERFAAERAAGGRAGEPETR